MIGVDYIPNSLILLQVSKCMELEEQCREEEKQHWARVAALIQVYLSSLPLLAYSMTLAFRLAFAIIMSPELNWFL